jgi:hypothetical protein
MAKPYSIALHAALLAVAVTALAAFSAPNPACGAGVIRSSGQTLYVPIYSHILFGDRAAQFNLAATLSIRNVDPEHPITITIVDYYDSAGRLVKHHTNKPIRLGPLASTEFFIAERDKTGGFGASFIVCWSSEKPVHAPLVESVMIGAQHGQGISFIGKARVIEDSPK